LVRLLRRIYRALLVNKPQDLGTTQEADAQVSMI
jgi:hypothetical protein